jgi:putative transposase
MGVEVSPDLISDVTNSVIDDVRKWQNPPLDNVYPVVFLDALVVKRGTDGKMINFLLQACMDKTAHF